MDFLVKIIELLCFLYCTNFYRDYTSNSNTIGRFLQTLKSVAYKNKKKHLFHVCKIYKIKVTDIDKFFIFC